MVEVSWSVGLSAGPVFLCRSWVTCQIWGPGPKCEGKASRAGEPGLPPTPSVTLRHTLRPTLLLFPYEPALEARVPSPQPPPPTTHHMGAQGWLSSPPQVAPWCLLLRGRGWASRRGGPPGVRVTWDLLGTVGYKERGIFVLLEAGSVGYTGIDL